MSNFEVKLAVVTEAETAQEALDDVLNAKWFWTVTNVDTDEVVELRA